MATKCLKFLRLTTMLRTDLDPEKISLERYDRIFSDPFLRVQVVQAVEAVLSGQVQIDFDKETVSFRAQAP